MPEFQFKQRHASMQTQKPPLKPYVRPKQNCFYHKPTSWRSIYG